MSKHNRDTLNRLLDEHGTSGLAEMLAQLCDERADHGEREVAPVYRAAAEAYRAI